MLSSEDRFVNPVHQPLILIIDDDRTTRLLVRTLLEQDGYSIVEAEDGAEGLACFQALQPDLVLLDAMMPLLDGFATCVRLRTLSNCEWLPILMLTSLTDNEAVDLAFESGATDYIIKPIHKAVLRQRVRHLVQAKHTKDKLLQREQLYRAIVEDQVELICRYLPDYRLTFVNEAYCRYFDKRQEDLVGHSFMSHIANEDRGLIEPHIASLSWKNPVQTLEHRVYMPNGEVRWQQWIDRAIFDEQQRLVEFQAVGRDITERKRMEAELYQKTAELQAVFEAIPDIFFRFDREGTILHHYAGSKTDFYGPPETYIGKRMSEILPTQVASLFQEAVVKVCQTRQLVTLEYSLPVAVGEQIYEARLWPFLEDQAIALVRNITERKQLETRMLNSQKLVDLGTLAAGVAHEINSPLQVITGVSQSLLDRLQYRNLEPEYWQRKLESIQRNGWRCAEIVRSLRIYAHVASSQAEPYDLNILVQDTLLLIEHQLKSWSDIIILTDLAPDLPLLFCDRNQITQMLINLLTNAQDAMSGLGEITIRTGYKPETGQLILQVTDTGCGIPPAIVDKIFDPFFTTKPIGQGTGLGLSIVAGIMHAYGGEIKVDSVLNHGTAVTLLFPKDTLRSASPSQPNFLGRFDDSVYPAFNLNK